MSNSIKVFRTFPKELFRVNNGLQVLVRDRTPRRRIYDIVTRDGWVAPLALNPTTYQAPNGASMRPNSPYQQHLVYRLFKGADVIVYSVPAGAELPKDLLLVHERTDHYSLQPAEPMSLSSLNDKITTLLYQNATIYERDQWMRNYPNATEFVQYPKKH